MSMGKLIKHSLLTKRCLYACLSDNENSVSVNKVVKY